MVRQSLILLIVSGLTLPCFGARASGADAGRGVTVGAAETAPAWPVATSLKTSLRDWARHAGWPAPKFLTDADWPVETPGSIPGSIETALKVLVQGFGRAPTRPRIEISANHVIVVSETGAE